MELPQELRSAIEDELKAGGAAVRDAAARLSLRYRAGGPGAGGFIGGAPDAAAYAAYRMPATFAAARAALSEAAERLAGFAPRSLLDAGAGTGAAAWAAAAAWPGLEAVTLLERDGNMAGLGRRLAARSPCPALRGGRWVEANLTGDWRAERADIAVLCYALGELPEERQIPVIRRLWEISGALVAVEPGTPEGSARIMRAREALIHWGARIAAPCPGNVPCPEEGAGWCHFAARVARSRLHRQAKGAELAYEDEKFAYLVAAKTECSPCGARVLRHPRILKGHVELELCTAEGFKAAVVPKSGAERYREARKLKWGSACCQIPPG